MFRPFRRLSPRGVLHHLINSGSADKPRPGPRLLPWAALLLLATLTTSPIGAEGNPTKAQSRGSNPALAKCRSVRAGSEIELVAPTFIYRLEVSHGLCGSSWENRLTGETIPLGGGAEVELDVDAARQRIFITGWKTISSDPGPAGPDAESGFTRGFASRNFDDTGWSGRAVPPSFETEEKPLFSGYLWARTHVFLPRDAESREVSLALGGFGLFDFRYLRVFVNGREVGTRLAEKRWSDPGVFDLGRRSKVHGDLRFGNDNVIAVQACGYRCRTAQLDEVDPHRNRSLPARYYWPGQFEQYLVMGKPFATPTLRVADVKVDEGPDSCRTTLELVSEHPRIKAKVTYSWNAAEPVLHKFVDIRNDDQEPIRFLNVRLGTFTTGRHVSEGEQGFPVYVDDQFFTSLAHPAGWAIGQDGDIRLRQFPGKALSPGEVLSCMETVLGVSRKGAARDAFIGHVRDRMRRVRRGHDKAYSIFDSFGAWPSGDWWGGTEEYLLKQIRDVLGPEVEESGCQYDFHSLELWRDIKGDLERPNPAHFPAGFGRIIEALAKRKIKFGLWTALTLASWTIGENPVVRPTLTHDPAYGCDGDLAWLCLAADPLRTMLSSAYRHQILENGLRLVKFDGLSSICYNPGHAHLPGVYSTEAIDDAFIQFLDELDGVCPDLFIMLYWGPRSPWWLLHADTLFEPGLSIEAAHPSSTPTPYVRDSVTLGLDQAQRFCREVPSLGKDSLGIWLSDWGWNSGIGKERWQEGFVMDMGRGGLLAQPWSDHGELSAAERGTLAEFIGLLKRGADCFRNSRPVLGDPWKNEPYGYCCSDGRRAFIALNNCAWSDRTIRLELNTAWGLPDGRRWDIYRWFPQPARLMPGGRAFQTTASIRLRPFEVELLEIVPAGEKPTLERSFEERPADMPFAEPSRAVELTVVEAPASMAIPVPCENWLKPSDLAALPPKRLLKISCQVPPSKDSGILAMMGQMRRGEWDAPQGNSGRYFAASVLVSGTKVRSDAIVPGESFPAPWQGFRIRIAPSKHPQTVEAVMAMIIPADVKIAWSGFFIR